MQRKTIDGIGEYVYKENTCHLLSTNHSTSLVCIYSTEYVVLTKGFQCHSSLRHGHQGEKYFQLAIWYHLSWF